MCVDIRQKVLDEMCGIVLVLNPKTICIYVCGMDAESLEAYRALTLFLQASLLTLENIPLFAFVMSHTYF